MRIQYMSDLHLEF
jgi:DNA repair exonuclease SbcCD nuclease subunit